MSCNHQEVLDASLQPHLQVVKKLPIQQNTFIFYLKEIVVTTKDKLI
jgi:hypothetical protein